MSPYYEDATVTLHHGDCLDVLRTLPDNSVDSVVTDPPYGLEFMGKDWDGPKLWREYVTDADKEYVSEGRNAPKFQTSRPSFSAGLPFQRWCELWAAECLRVLRPGGHMLAFGGSRTYHRMTSGVEDAGFEIRDCITWHFGSGFPKSLNVSDALDRIVPADARCVCGPSSTRTPQGSPVGYPSSHGSDGEPPQSAGEDDPTSAPSPAGARGRTRDDLPAGGQAVAPASTDPDADSDHPSNAGSPHPSEPLREASPTSVDARSDTGTSTSAAPVRELRRTTDHTPRTSGLAAGAASSSPSQYKHMACAVCGGVAIPKGLGTALKPASEFIVVARKPLAGTVAQSVLTYGTGALNIDATRIGANTTSGSSAGRWPSNVVLDESQAQVLDSQTGELASGSRKAGTYSGLGYMGSESADFPSIEGSVGGASRFMYVAKAPAVERPRVDGVAHATVKPLDLMRWLTRLVTPPGGTVLEPFAGSGTTVEACLLEGFRCIAIEREDDYLPLIRQRIARRRDPVAAVRAEGGDAGLFDLLDGGAA